MAVCGSSGLKSLAVFLRKKAGTYSARRQGCACQLWQHFSTACSEVWTLTRPVIPMRPAGTCWISLSLHRAPYKTLLAICERYVTSPLPFVRSTANTIAARGGTSRKSHPMLVGTSMKTRTQQCSFSKGGPILTATFAAHLRARYFRIIRSQNNNCLYTMKQYLN